MGPVSRSVFSNDGVDRCAIVSPIDSRASFDPRAIGIELVFIDDVVGACDAHVSRKRGGLDRGSIVIVPENSSSGGVGGAGRAGIVRPA